MDIYIYIYSFNAIFASKHLMDQLKRSVLYFETKIASRNTFNVTEINKQCKIYILSFIIKCYN